MPDIRCSGTDLRLEERGFPEGAIISQPGVAPQKQVIGVALKTLARHNLNGEAKAYVERDYRELRVISHRLISRFA